MNFRRRSSLRRAAPALVLAVVLLAGAFLAYRVLSADGAQEAADGFAQDWSAGSDRAAARRTTEPAKAARALAADRRGLDGAKVSVEATGVEESGDRATGRLKVSWRVPRIGNWSYESPISLAKSGDKWRLRWAPDVVHPKLDDATRLGTTVIPGSRGEILDGGGRALMRERPVKRVGVVAGKVKDPVATARALAGAVDVDAGPLARAIRTGGRQQFVEAIALREADFRRVEPRLKGVPGVSVVDGTAVLAPSRAFARALLGGVGPATKEQVDRSRGRVAAGDSVGQWGLQARFERRLAAVPERRIVIRADGVPIERLEVRRGRAGRDVRTALDQRVQAAAETALGSRPDEAALVAVRPSSGAVLAVANRPVESTYNRALEGTYAPGSTFKVISTAALLRKGLDVNETVNCPPTLTAGGRSFKNFEGGAEGPVPFRRDFAVSCNTAFVSLAGRLAPTDLRATALDYGLGRKLRMGVRSADGQVPPGKDGVQRAAAMIGQHEILASPLATAGVAATVADGRWRSPRLLPGDPRTAGRGLPAGERDTLRELMRGVVTEGSGTALSGVGGEPAGKSGTAEFGGGNPPPTHAWFVAFRGDLALAVMVERGRSGGAVAAPLAARFLEALDR